MDPATLLGLLIAFGSLVAMITLEGASVTSILIPAPMILVFGATIAVAIASGSLGDALLAAKALPRAFRGKVLPAGRLIDDVVAIAERARREGLLALEQEAATVDDPMLRSALQSIADGVDPDDLREQLEETIAARERSERIAAKFYTTMGGYAPTIGIIGTVVSLTHVLENLSTPDELGHMIAAAFVATLWGVLSSNLIWLPIGARLGRLTDQAVERQHLLLEGVLAVQQGAQPRALRDKLSAMVTEQPKEKPTKAKAEPVLEDAA